MAGIPSENVRDVREALRVIVSDPDLGAATLSSPQAMSNLLKDLLPDAPREKNLLIAAAEADLAGLMLDRVGQGIDAPSAIRLAAASFGENTHFSEGVCTWVASELAVALDLAPDLAGERSVLPADEAPEPATTADQAGTAQAGTAKPEAAGSVSPETVAARTRLATEVLGTSAEPLTAEQSGSDPGLTAVRPGDAASAGADAPLVSVGATSAGTGPASAGPASAGTTSAAAAHGTWIGTSVALVLAGLVASFAGYLVPVYYDSYYGGVSVWGHGLPGYVTLIGSVMIALTAFCAALIVRARGSRIRLAAASSGIVVSALLIALMFGIIYWTSVRTNGERMGAGLVAGSLGVILLLAGGLGELFRQQAAERTASRQVSPPAG